MDVECKSSISNLLFEYYVENLKRLNINHPNIDHLDNILKTKQFGENIDKNHYIEDPLFLMLLTMCEKNQLFSDIVKSFNEKASLFKIRSPKILKYKNDDIDDIIIRYITLTPKKVLKDISDDEISDISRRNSTSQVSSPVMNY